MGHSAEKDALLVQLVRREISGEDCEVVGFTGSGRCIEPAVGLRWEDGFHDAVCAEHAARAESRGVLVVYADTRVIPPAEPGADRGSES